MGALSNLYATTIGKKVVMALTGVVLFGFAIGHMAGNLLVFLGPDAINGYAATLKGTPLLLWGTRLTLLFAFPVHIVSAIQLVQLNNKARPAGYGQWKDAGASSYASRTMRYGGIIFLFFLLYHLSHYTLFFVDGSYADLYTTMADGTEVHDVFTMVLAGFGHWWNVALYLIAMGALFMHLDHGAWSFMQSLGMNHPKWNPMRRQFARGLAGTLFVGFSLVPVFCFLQANNILNIVPLVQ
jgi:succinate dehydrogenase / fumarate reductase, cytochrome b subunit